MASDKCYVCGKQAHQTCVDCGLKAYCSTLCADRDYPTHEQKDCLKHHMEVVAKHLIDLDTYGDHLMVNVILHQRLLHYGIFTRITEGFVITKNNRTFHHIWLTNKLNRKLDIVRCLLNTRFPHLSKYLDDCTYVDELPENLKRIDDTTSSERNELTRIRISLKSIQMGKIKEYIDKLPTVLQNLYA